VDLEWDFNALAPHLPEVFDNVAIVEVDDRPGGPSHHIMLATTQQLRMLWAAKTW
jgi:hypothetical protein